MNTIYPLIALMLFPGGLFLLTSGLVYEYVDRKLVARFQNRVGPRWFQPLADVIKLLAKEEIIPKSVQSGLFIFLPVVGMAGALTSALYVPMFGLKPSFSFPGDLIVTFYLLSTMTLCLGLAGSNTNDRFSLIGATRTLTQLFSYEAPFLLALLGPAITAQSWQISEINNYAASNVWLIVVQPVGFVVALVGLMGKLELPPFDSPEAETEIVSGALTEYSGRGLALFHLGKDIEMVHWLNTDRRLLPGWAYQPPLVHPQNPRRVCRDGCFTVALCPPPHRPDRRPVVAHRGLAGSGTIISVGCCSDRMRGSVMRIGANDNRCSTIHI